MADKIPIKINGLPEALAMLKKYQSKKKEQIKVELDIGAKKIELQAKSAAPWEYGILSASITTDTRDLALLVVRVGTHVIYAPHQEFGTKFMAAQPYLYPAFFSHENEIVKAIGKVLRKDIGLK